MLSGGLFPTTVLLRRMPRRCTKRCALCHKLPTQHYPYTIVQSPSSHHPIILDLLTYHCATWNRLIRSLRALCVQDNDCAFVTCYLVPRSGIASPRRCSLRIQSPCGSWKAWNMSTSRSLDGSHCARVTLGGAMVSTDSPEMGTRRIVSPGSQYRIIHVWAPVPEQ